MEAAEEEPARHSLASPCWTVFQRARPWPSFGSTTTGVRSRRHGNVATSPGFRDRSSSGGGSPCVRGPASVKLSAVPYEAWAAAADRPGATLRRMLLGAILLVLVQAGLGMVVNLYVTVPGHHPGSRPANYFAGSFHSLAWAVAHGAATLAVHVTLGLALAVFVVGAAVYALRSGRRAVGGWSVLAGLFVIGAGFNGASFLDFADNISSLIMALLALAAIGCYAIALALLGPSGPPMPG